MIKTLYIAISWRFAKSSSTSITYYTLHNSVLQWFAKNEGRCYGFLTWREGSMNFLADAGSEPGSLSSLSRLSFSLCPPSTVPHHCVPTVPPSHVRSGNCYLFEASSVHRMYEITCWAHVYIRVIQDLPACNTNIILILYYISFYNKSVQWTHK